VTEFEQLADARWERGIREIREGDGERPFKGDPIKEGIEECLDGYNYAVQAWRDHRMTIEQCKEICGLMVDAFLVFKAAR